MNYNNYFGNYQELIVGQASENEIRLAGASGGVVSSILVNALEKGLIDAAVVVGMNKNQPWLPQIKIAKTKKDVLLAAGSKYSFIPFKDVIEVIKSVKNKRIAVVGLPCHIQIIRGLQKNKKISHVKYLIGLFCGYNMDYDATEFLLRKMKIKKEDIKELKYRGGKYPGGFYVILKNNKIIRLPKHYYDFLNLMFSRQGCHNCKDYMNEKADIAVGDSWGYKNCSLAFIRTKKGKKLFEMADIKFEKISEKKVLKMHDHNIKHKKLGDSQTQSIIKKGLVQTGEYIPLKLLGILAKTRRIILRK